ncbi:MULTISPECIES: sensor histidine kinase [unclassified Marinitoga]|uniref:sensor histidine kinase n=1 Tax=unclassified Marinitoga TaxID=2640159 RepID=UPI000952CB6C|nr:MULTISPECIES: histidine kinase [unclassified Marinitoga]
MKNRRLLKVLLITQLIALSITYFIYLYTPYFNIQISLIITELFVTTIGVIYYISTEMLFHTVKIEIKFLRRIIKILIFVFSFFSGVFIAEDLISRLLSYTFFSTEKYVLLIYSIIVLILTLLLIIIYYKLKNKIEENEKLKQEKLKAELKALRSKLNPHFLFNTLNTIIDLAYTSPEKVEQVVINLSDIYRKVLYSSDKDFCTVEEEISLIKEYLEIEKIRFGSRLKCNFEISKETLKLKIPPFILEPFVENAVIHGISPKKEGGIITIKTYLEKNTLFLEIWDNGSGTHKNIQYGFGINSVIERLNLIYKNNAEVKILKNKPSGVKVIILMKNIKGNEQ